MSEILCTGATFVKKNSCLVGIIVSFDTAGLHVLTFRILEITWLRSSSISLGGYGSKIRKVIPYFRAITTLGNWAWSQSRYLSWMTFYSTRKSILIWINTSKFPSCQNIIEIFSKTCCGGDVATSSLLCMRLLSLPVAKQWN